MAFLLYDDDFTSAPRRERSVEQLKPSEMAYWQARRESTLELNPTWQLGATHELEALEPFKTDFYTDEMGMQQPITRGGLDPADPRARRLGLEEANDRGRDVGLRFSEPPTEGQFEYLRTRKVAENERDAIIAQAPSNRVWAGGFLGDLAASAIDPLNIATAFVPVVRDTRFLQWATRFGRGPARAMKGAAEGFVGSAMVTPLIYSQAQRLQQNYDANAVMADLAVGTVLGSGLHWGGGLAKDIYKGELRLENRIYSIGSFIRRHDPRSAFEAKSKAGRDAPSVTKGENAGIVEAMSPETRGATLNVAVKSLGSDQFPRIDEILRGAPELTSISIPDTRFTATTRYRVPFSSADYARNTPGTAMLNEMAHSMVKTGQSPVKSLMQSFAGRYGKLKDVVVRQLGPTEFATAAKTLVEVPEQRVVYDPLTKQLLVAEGATPGAIRHEIEKALDDLYGHKGDQAGAYRFKNSDNDGPVGLRQAIGELYHREPGRRPGQPTSARDAITKATEPQGDLMLTRGPQASRDAWDAVQEHKDRDLETIIKDEELEAVETIASANQGFVRDLGILEKIIPAEERAILDEAITRQAKQSAERDLFSAMDEVADAKEVNQSLRDAEMLIKAGPDRLAEVIRGKKTEGQVLAQMEAEGYVTRDVARRSIATYLNTIGLPAPEPEAPKIREISGEQMEEAIRLVQAGEDVDVAVRTAVQAGELLKAAEEALEAAETRFELPGEEGKGAGLEDDLFNEMMEILDKEAITSTEQLAEFESEVVLREQALLAEHPQTEHLANMTEKDEFNEANRNRALRKGSGAVERGERAARDLGSQGRALEDGLFATRVGDGSADSGGARDVIERERGASGGHRPAPETVASYGGWAVPTRVITPDNSIEVGITPRIVELSDLAHAEGALQVRDRSRKESRAEAMERALKLDPEQLLPTRVADAGAPIVWAKPDGGYVIISGNGRVMSLREVYRDETLGWKARQYRERIGPATDGYRRPVLVSVITDELSPEELIRFAERANRSRIAEMSATEKAQRDADVAGYEIMGMYQGGDFTKRENQPFLRAFLRKVATTQELGDLSKNGVLTKSGVDRLNAAVLAAAYDDANLLSLMLESADLNIKSIANAYRDVAPAFMKLRAQIAQGIVREEMDLTPFMIEAARFVSKARDEGVKIGNALAQSDALNPIDPTVEALVRQFYNPQLTRANSALRIGQWLQFYVDSALEKRTGGFLEDTTSIRDVVAATDRRVERQGETFDAEDETSIADIAAHVGTGDPQGGPAQPQSGAGEGGTGAGQPVKGRAKQAAARQAAEATQSLANRAIEKVGGIEEVKRALQTPGATDADIMKLFQGLERSGQIDEAKVPAKATGALPKASELINMTVKDLRALAKEQQIPLTKLTRKDDIVRRMRESGKFDGPQPQVEREAGLTDEQIDALPEPEAEPPARAPVSDAVRRSFYDFLETDQPVKGAGHVAKVLKLSVEEAGHLIDEAIEAGWLKVNSKDQIIRVAKTARPARPDRPKLDAPSFVDNASSRLAQILDEEMLGNPVDGFKLDDNARSYIIGSDGKLYEIYGDSFPHKEVYEHIDFLADGGIQISTFGYGGFGGQFTTVTRQAFFNLGRYLKMAEMKRSDVLWRPDPDTQGLAEFAFVKDSDKERFRGLGYKNLPDSYNELHENFKLKLDGPSFADVVGFRGGKLESQRKIDLAQINQISERIDALRERLSDTTDEAEIASITKELDEANAKIWEIQAREDERSILANNDEELGRLYKESREVRAERVKVMDDINEIVGPDDPGDLAEGFFDEARLAELREEARLQREAAIANQDAFSQRRLAVLQQRLAALQAKQAELDSAYAKRLDAILESFADTPKGWESAGEMDDIQAFVSHQEAQLQAHLAIQKVWDRSLHRIPDIIRMRIVERLQMGGYGRAAALFNPETLTIMVSAADLYEIPNGRKPGETIPHELFHALRKLDLFLPEEWALLKRAFAIAREGFSEFDRDRYGRRYTNYWRDAVVKRGGDPDEPGWAEVIDDKLVEEYAATEYGKWQEMRDKNRETWQGRLWQRVSDFLEDVYNGFKRFADDLKMKLNRRGMDLVEDEWLPLRGPDNVRELFRAIERGDFARAWADASAGRTGPDNSMSMASMALQEMSEDLNAQMRTLAQDKSESVGRLKAEVLKRLAPCASYHL